MDNIGTYAVLVILLSGVALLTWILMSKFMYRSGRSGRSWHTRCIN